jgi:energy-converting hydrogenase A subunit O
MNLEAYKYMLKTCPTVADAISAYTSIDPCISCTERSIIAIKNGKEIPINLKF